MRMAYAVQLAKKSAKNLESIVETEPQSYISVVHVDAFAMLFPALCGRELIIAAQ